MSPIGMPQTINGKLYVETEDGYETIDTIPEISPVTTVDTVEPPWMMPVTESFTFTLETNNHRKYHGRPLRRGRCNPKRWIDQIFGVKG